MMALSLSILRCSIFKSSCQSEKESYSHISSTMNSSFIYQIERVKKCENNLHNLFLKQTSSRLISMTTQARQVQQKSASSIGSKFAQFWQLLSDIQIKRMQRGIRMKMLLILLVSSAMACTAQQQPKLLSVNAFSTNSSCLEDCCASLSPRPPMTYYYYQNTGRFRGGSGDYAINVLGYSGEGAGYLNPDYQCKQGGPLPASTYEVAFCKNIMHQVTQRPCSFYLKPLVPTEVCGRDDFFIHGCQSCTSGDDSDPPAAGCSAGCVIISYKERRKIRIGDKIIVNNYQPKIDEAELQE